MKDERWKNEKQGILEDGDTDHRGSADSSDNNIRSERLRSVVRKARMRKWGQADTVVYQPVFFGLFAIQTDGIVTTIFKFQSFFCITSIKSYIGFKENSINDFAFAFRPCDSYIPFPIQMVARQPLPNTFLCPSLLHSGVLEENKNKKIKKLFSELLYL